MTSWRRSSFKLLLNSYRKRVALDNLEQQDMGYIDESGTCSPLAEKRPAYNRPLSPRRQAVAKRVCKDRDSPLSSASDFQATLSTVKLRERNSPRKQKNSARYSGLHAPVLNDPDKPITRLTWHGKDRHSTLIRIDWPAEASTGNLTTSTINSSPVTPVTPSYDLLESDSEASDNKHTITITNDCDNCAEGKCLKCELQATDYESTKDAHDSPEASPLHSTDISYQNLNRLSAVSTSSNSEQLSRKEELMKIMTSSHESSSTYSNVSLKHDELYECYNYTRPNYINLQSSSTSKSSPGSPSRSPLKSTISITFRSPAKCEADHDTPTNERDSVYEDVDLDKNLSIVEEASVPEADASLPTQQACQPAAFAADLIILETPTETRLDDPVDVYSRVKFFRQSIEEVNAMLLESPEREYENVHFRAEPDYENINVGTLRICDKVGISAKRDECDERENGNVPKPKVATNLNVRELAIRFESPTEQKGPFAFEKYKAEARAAPERGPAEKSKEKKLPPPTSPKTYKLSKSSSNARSLDENAFIKEFGTDKDRRKSLEVRDAKRTSKFLPDLNLNTEEPETKLHVITPTSENKISLVQRFEVKPDLKSLIGFEAEKKLSRERIEKYKEERRNFLREKYSSQSFRSNPEQLTRIKLKKEDEKIENCERLKEGKFERRNTVDLGQRMRFSLARSANALDAIPSPPSPAPDFGGDAARARDDREEGTSPSYNIRDMAARFEQKSQSSTSG